MAVVCVERSAQITIHISSHIVRESFILMNSGDQGQAGPAFRVDSVGGDSYKASCSLEDKATVRRTEPREICFRRGRSTTCATLKWE